MGDLNQRPDPRIEAMHRRDVLVAWAFVIGLWLCDDLRGDCDLGPSRRRAGARTPASDRRCAVVLVFNTAAILAMLRHYREDRDFMYGLDIKFQRRSPRACDRGRALMAHYKPPAQGKTGQLIDVDRSGRS